MPDCASIDPLVTPYIDGELAPPERDAVQRHLMACPPCHARVAAEQTVHGLLASHKDVLRRDCASDRLRATCRTLSARNGEAATFAAGWRARIMPLATAAALVLFVGGAFLYQLTARSSRVMAAELTADHMKCFALNGVLGTHQEAATVESSLAAGFDWPVHLPEQPGREGLELVGSRPCLYAEGRVAHIMFRHNGQPVSLFMLPKTRGADEVVRVFGHEATIWSVGNRTFVLIAREDEATIERLVAFVRTSVR